ncbi:hypothetical protein GCM10011363_45180 [Marivita lacus]|uniref:Helix-turn-helix domain-containing protein n=1 Tax=Marivita lacus TaxID=1323742 RepID=A0ABQ1LER9_9RHOB|nr:hypothetical protein [Marivita lacus]GGC23641.1 hypothetical protein GCM10011363_45180 [Marivita lacus]
MFLTENDRETLLTALNAKNSEVVQARMANALLLLADGLSVEDVAGLMYLDEASVTGWVSVFSKRNPQGN